MCVSASHLTPPRQGRGVVVASQVSPTSGNGAQVEVVALHVAQATQTFCTAGSQAARTGRRGTQVAVESQRSRGSSQSLLFSDGLQPPPSGAGAWQVCVDESQYSEDAHGVDAHETPTVAPGGWQVADVPSDDTAQTVPEAQNLFGDVQSPPACTQFGAGRQVDAQHSVKPSQSGVEWQPPPAGHSTGKKQGSPAATWPVSMSWQSAKAPGALTT